MSDIKLFRHEPTGVTQLEAKSVVIEKTLQSLMERNLDAFLGVRLLASEYPTGKVHGGRIDTLGIDENNSPVIIEYKRSLNESVINQGLFYLDWLLDHRAEFQLLAMKKLGTAIEAKINWPGARLICIAADFTRYDEHAVNQIGRSIELIRYKSFGPDLLLLELVNSTSGVPPAQDGEVKASGTYKTVTQLLGQSPPEVVDLYHQLDAFLTALGDVQVNPTKTYIAYRRIKNFASVAVSPKYKLVFAWVKVDPKTVTLEEGFTRDVSSIGHAGTGDLEITLRSADDLERAKRLFLVSYEAS
jgi:predicted transport protein